MAAVALRIAWFMYRTAVAAWTIDELLSHGEVGDAPNMRLRRLQVVHRVGGQPAGATEDVRITTHDFVNLTNGQPDDTWNDADYLAVEAAMDTFWTNLAPRRANVTVSEYRWYRVVPGETKPGPPRRVVMKNIAGSATAQLPPQIACTVTEITGLRKHWGRFFIPQLGTNVAGTNGRLHPGAQLDIATFAETMYDSIVANSATIVPVVYSPRLRGALRVRRVQVDDVFDVQRSRRFETVNAREVRDITSSQIA